MSIRNNKLVLTLIISFLVTIFALPYLKTLGVSFDVVLVALFGEGSIWALLFSLLLIASIVLVLRKLIIKYP